MSCGLYVNRTAVVSLASPLAVISKLQWPHIHTQTRCTDIQTDRCQCVSPISKCLDSAQEERVGQMLSWQKNLCLWASLWSNSFSLIYFLLLSEFLFLFSTFRSFHPHSCYFFPLLFPSTLYIFTHQTSSNPESQWVCKLMQRICEELGIQLEKIRLLSFEPDI